MRTVDISKTNKEIFSTYKEEIFDFYINNPNIMDLISKFGVSRSFITNKLKEAGLYKGFAYTPSKAVKRSQTLKERYGVSNFGQTKQMLQKLNGRNAIPFDNFVFNAELIAYKREVARFTNKNKKYVVDNTFCYYTGIKFADTTKTPNPNDPCKRTMDHKIGIVTGFLEGIDAKVIGGVANIVWCIRYCNSFKGNMSANAFEPCARLLRERLIDEGFEHN